MAFVTVTATGEPVKDMTIDMRMYSNGSTPAAGRTGADGTFKLIVRPGTYTLVISGAARQGLFLPLDNVRKVTVDAQHPMATVDYQCARNPTPGVSGRVIDTKGNPVPAAEIGTHAGNYGMMVGNFNLYDAYDYADGTTTTDAKGHFSIPFVSDGASLRVSKGDAFLTPPYKIDSWHRDLELLLPDVKRGALVVSVVDGANQPLADAQVKITGIDDFARKFLSGKTDADGTFRVADLITQYTYRIEVSRDGYSSGSVDRLSIQPDVQNQTPTLKLFKADGFIAGTVVDEVGKPIPGALVQAIGLIGMGQPMQAHADAAGRFRLENLVPGTSVRITAFNPGMPQSVRGAQLIPVGTDNAVIVYRPMTNNSGGR